MRSTVSRKRETCKSHAFYAAVIQISMIKGCDTHMSRWRAEYDRRAGIRADHPAPRPGPGVTRPGPGPGRRAGATAAPPSWGGSGPVAGTRRAAPMFVLGAESGWADDPRHWGMFRI